ncbi:MAG TPA: STAS domain-containing protein [Rectinemataceae bacterium]|nr:STAS domain-containing protein [Rectinemataceae bacterium]
MSSDSPPAVIHLFPTLSIDRAAEFKDQLVEALAASDSVILDFSLVEEIDLACLQLVYAVRSSAREAGKKLALSSLPSPHVLARLAAAGFLRADPREGGISLDSALVDV